jgi:hypothetical protein
MKDILYFLLNFIFEFNLRDKNKVFRQSLSLTAGWPMCDSRVSGV